MLNADLFGKSRLILCDTHNIRARHVIGGDVEGQEFSSPTFRGLEDKSSRMEARFFAGRELVVGWVA